ncbi:hypothetical protein V8G54_006547 [Vigna mungo]|uniref:Uncharacterized protein n=1 Tax=Vigna mungo TaxID=3915 RepID=A0AAQ3P1J7_VIGMU
MAQFSLSPPSFPTSPLPLRRRILFAPPPRTAASSATDAVSTSTSSSASNYAPKVIVTRERGKNSKLIAALVLASVHSLNLSLLRFVFLGPHCNVLNLIGLNLNELAVPCFPCLFSYLCLRFLQSEQVFAVSFTYFQYLSYVFLGPEYHSVL